MLIIILSTDIANQEDNFRELITIIHLSFVANFIFNKSKQFSSE